MPVLCVTQGPLLCQFTHFLHVVHALQETQHFGHEPLGDEVVREGGHEVDDLLLEVKGPGATSPGLDEELEGTDEAGAAIVVEEDGHQSPRQAREMWLLLVTCNKGWVKRGVRSSSMYWNYQG